jgi:AraC-like DNA-binding protein
MDYERRASWEMLSTHLVESHVPRPTSDYGRVRCEIGWSWRPALRDYDLWLVLTGRGRAQVADLDVRLGAGSLFVLRPGDTGVFHQVPDDRLTVAYCHFDFFGPGAGTRVEMPEELLPSRWFAHIDLARLSGLMQRLVRLRRDAHPLRQWESNAALVAVLAEVYRQDARSAGHPAPTDDPRLQDVLDFLADNVHRRPSLDEAAATACLSAGRLSRLFSEQMGTSVRSYMVDIRLERAHHLLVETSMTITEIARALGYPDLFLFSRQFRQRYGLPPRGLRRAVAGDPTPSGGTRGD